MFENHAQNNKSISSCYFVVGNCPNCEFKEAIRHGFNKNCIQRFRCKGCKMSFVATYSRRYINNAVNEEIKILLKEGCGIRSIGRILKISAVTVLRKIKAMAKQLPKPLISFDKEYELDELCTYVKSKGRKYWVAYVIRKDTRAVVDFSIGGRTKNTLRKLTDTLILSNAKKVFTDKLPNYQSLLPSKIHSTKYRGTNHIERKNLTLRTHLKRLSRRTICFSKSTAMLHACLMIYFFG